MELLKIVGDTSGTTIYHLDNERETILRRPTSWWSISFLRCYCTLLQLLEPRAHVEVVINSDVEQPFATRRRLKPTITIVLVVTLSGDHYTLTQIDIVNKMITYVDGMVTNEPNTTVVQRMLYSLHLTDTH